MSTWNFENAQQTVGWPWGIGVQRGNVPKMSGIDKFGYLEVAATTYRTVWDGDSVYTYPSSALAMTATSQSGTPGDDEGVQVTIEGLDENYASASETVTLNASGTATTDTTFIRVFRAFVANGQESTDDINISNGATDYAIIKQEFQQTMMAVYTIPAGKRGYLVSGNISVEKNQPVVAKLMVRRPGGVLRAQGLVSTFGVPFQRKWELPPVLGARTDIEIRAKAGATTSIAAGFEILLEDD